MRERHQVLVGFYDLTRTPLTYIDLFMPYIVRGSVTVKNNVPIMRQHPMSNTAFTVIQCGHCRFSYGEINGSYFWAMLPRPAMSAV